MIPYFRIKTDRAVLYWFRKLTNRMEKNLRKNIPDKAIVYYRRLDSLLIKMDIPQNICALVFEELKYDQCFTILSKCQSSCLIIPLIACALAVSIYYLFSVPFDWSKVCTHTYIQNKIKKLYSV